MGEILNNTLFFFVLFNPFLMSIYLMDLIRDRSHLEFFRILLRASLISGAVFIIVGLFGDKIFKDVLFVHFSSFQIFGGLVFIVIGIRYLFQGSESIRSLRGGNPQHLEGSVAMPFMIGPGTISAAIVIGSRLHSSGTIITIVLTLFATVISLVLLKRAHDRIKKKNSLLIEKYIEIVGRLSALYIGTVAIEMISTGIRSWFFPS